MPTCRVLVTGKFDRPDTETRARLLASPADGLDKLRFDEEGNLAYSESLASFTFRCVVAVEPGQSAERDAIAEAEFKALEVLAAGRYPFRDIRSSATCMDDIKIRRHQQAAARAHQEAATIRVPAGPMSRSSPFRLDRRSTGRQGSHYAGEDTTQS